MRNLNAETHQLLDDSIGKYLASEYDFDSRRLLLTQDSGYSPEHWRSFAEFGWLAIPFDESYGGMDGSALDTLGLMRAFGGALVVEPYVSTCGLAGELLATGATDTVKEQYLPRIVSGELIATLAWNEADARGNPSYVGTTATKTDGGYRLIGEKVMVTHASLANLLLVSARLDGGVADQEGIGVFLLTPETDGVDIAPYTAVDGHRAANIAFDCPVSTEALLCDNFEALQRALDIATLMYCSEGLGAMEVLLDTTLDYTRVRKQFGTAIATFQAVRHRLADMYIAYQQFENMFQQTLEKAESELPDRQAMAAMAAQFSKSATYVAEQSVQLHGGIGMTDELAVGHYLKRLTSIRLMLGSEELHLRQLWQSLH